MGQDTREVPSIVIQLMCRALDPLRKLLNLGFPRQDGAKHEAFRDVSMSTRRLALLSVFGVVWALFCSTAAYYLALKFKQYS